MIFTWLFSLLFSIIGFFLQILPTVTELPFGISDALSFAVQTMNAIVVVIPFLAVPWIGVKFFLFVEVAVFSFGVVMWVITLGKHNPKTF